MKTWSTTCFRTEQDNAIHGAMSISIRMRVVLAGNVMKCALNAQLPALEIAGVVGKDTSKCQSIQKL